MKREDKRAKDILDDLSDKNNTIRGEILWVGYFKSRHSFFEERMMKTLINTLAFLSFIFLINIFMAIFIDSFDVIFSSIKILYLLVIIFYFYLAFSDIRDLRKIEESKYIVTSSNIYQVDKEDNIIFDELMEEVHKIAAVETSKEFGAVKIYWWFKEHKVKPLKMIISHDLDYHQLVIDGIKDYKEVAELIANKRNNILLG